MQITSLAKKKKSLNAFLVQSPCAYNHSVNVYTVDSTRGGCEWRTLVQQNAVCDQRSGGMARQTATVASHADRYRSGSRKGSRGHV